MSGAGSFGALARVIVLAAALLALALAGRPAPRGPRPTSFVCPDCGAPALVITRAIELPLDDDFDENALSALRCAACGMTGAAAYRESRRGGGESWSHDGCHLPRPAYDALVAEIDHCPAPHAPACRCASHRRLGRQEQGRWPGLAVVGCRAEFPIVEAMHAGEGPRP